MSVIRSAPDINEVRSTFEENNGTLVGWQYIKAEPDWDNPCQKGCLAPGSSPHHHSVYIGYRFIGHRGILETDLNYMGLKVSTVYPFAEDARSN